MIPCHLPVFVVDHYYIVFVAILHNRDNHNLGDSRHFECVVDVWLFVFENCEAVGIIVKLDDSILPVRTQ